MIALLAKCLRGQRGRTRLAIAGVATCTLLVIVIVSAFRGVRTAMSGYAGQTGIDLWVAPHGSDNLIRGSSLVFIPLSDLAPIRALPGVASADPILRAFLPVERPGVRDPNKRLTLLVIGFRLPDGLGGPPAYAAGRPPRAPNEVALDRAAAFRMGVGIGDAVEVIGFRAVVTGLTTGTNIMASQFVFADFDAAAAGSGMTGRAAFILVKLAPGADGDAVGREIEQRFPSLRAYSRETFVAANGREVTAGFVPLLTLITLLGLGAAALLIGLLVLSVMDERRSDIAVLIALGLGAGTAGRGVFLQAAWLSLRGTLIGALLAGGLKLELDAALPTIPLRLSVADIAAIAILFILTGTGSAVAPVLRLNAIDPLEAFRT